MRPRSADTSEPACVKRKMLSMKRSMSRFSSSRKYSAMASAESATRARAPGGSFICPYTSTHWLFARSSVLDDARLDHLVVEVVPLAGALADAGEHREAAALLRDVVHELHEEHGLADAGAAEEADLAAAEVGGEQVDDLDAGLERLDLHVLLDEGRRGAVDRQLARRR